MTMLSDYAPLIALVLGSGVGLTGIKAFFWLGKKAQELEERAKTIGTIETKLEEREEIDELVRTLDRDFGGLREDLKAFLTDHATAREDDARTEERVHARLDSLEREVKRIGKFFSQTFPRARTPSKPDLEDHDDEEK